MNKPILCDPAKPGSASAQSLAVHPPDDNNVKDTKMERINMYLESCARYTNTNALENVGRPRSNKGGGDDDDNDDNGDCYNEVSVMRPTKNWFWRDGEKVFTDDAHDGLSTDFRVRFVYLNIEKTLKVFALCSNVCSDITTLRKVKEYLRAFRHEMVLMEATDNQVKLAKRAGYLMSSVKDLALAMDTSRGIRRLVVNQMDPYSCCVSIDSLKKLCRFSGFGKYNDKYGSLECRFYLPVKLLFLGNLEIKRYEHDQDGSGSGDEEERGYTVYILEISHHFGPYFHEFLETLYNVCFEKLEDEFRRYKENKTLKDKQKESLTECFETKASPLSSLASLSSPSACRVSQANLLDTLDEFVRRDSYKTLGTTGKANREARLRYIRYDKTTSTVVEDDPVEEADAVFVSSYIAVRISRKGEVYMDVYARHALQLEVYNNEDKV